MLETAAGLLSLQTYCSSIVFGENECSHIFTFHQPGMLMRACLSESFVMRKKMFLYLCVFLFGWDYLKYGGSKTSVFENTHLHVDWALRISGNR